MRTDVWVGLTLTATLGVAVAGGVVGGLAGCQHNSGIDRMAHYGAVREYDQPLSRAAAEEGVRIEELHEAFYRAGRLVVGGQPKAKDLRALRAQGVGTVINLRSNKEMGDRGEVGYDEAAEAEHLGMTYVHIPLGGGDGYKPADVDAFVAALEVCHGDALVHCASGNRARAMWSAYLIRERGWTEADADRLMRTLGAHATPLEQLLGDEG